MGRAGRKIKRYEVQTFQCGEPRDGAFECCMKKDSHCNYIRPAELMQRVITTDDKLLDFIKTVADLTCLLEVDLPGNQIRCGTCFVQKIEKYVDTPCPCQDCKNAGHTSFGKVTLSTAFHVIPKSEDAGVCKARLFYDCEDSRDQEKIIYGLKSHSADEAGDWCALVCVTHDLELVDKLDVMLTQYWELGHELQEKYQNSNVNVVVVVSHPHGGAKRVSIGKGKVKDFALEVREDQDWCYYSYNASTCDGSSGAPVYVLGRWNDGFGYWFGHSHNHSGVDDNGNNSTTIGVDSTYDRVLKSYSSIDINTQTTMKNGEDAVSEIIVINSEEQPMKNSDLIDNIDNEEFSSFTNNKGDNKPNNGDENVICNGQNDAKSQNKVTHSKRIKKSLSSNDICNYTSSKLAKNLRCDNNCNDNQGLKSCNSNGVDKNNNPQYCLNSGISNVTMNDRNNSVIRNARSCNQVVKF